MIHPLPTNAGLVAVTEGHWWAATTIAVVVIGIICIYLLRLSRRLNEPEPRSTGTPARLVGKLRSVSQILSLIVVAVGCFVLVGWAFNIEPIKRVIPTLKAMNPMTAVSLILAGASLLLQREDAPHQRLRRVAQALAGVVVLIGCARLSNFAFHFEAGVDQLLFYQRLQSPTDTLPNRMAPNSALILVLIGAALLLLDFHTPKGRRPAQYLAIVASMMSLLAILGYAYDVVPLYGVGHFIPMALHTAGCFALLSVGVLFARPTGGMMTIGTSDTSAGIITRRLVPTIIAVPVLLGWLRLMGERSSLFSPELGLSLLVVANVVAFILLVWWTANLLYRGEMDRRSALLAVRETQERYQAVVQQTAEGIYLLDADSKQVIESNPAFQRLLGYTPDQARSLSVYDFVGHAREDIDTRLATTLVAGGHVSGERQYRRKDGTLVDVLTTASVIKYGEREALCTVVRDITQRKKAEEERDRFFMMSMDLLSVGGMDGYFKRVNPAFEKTLGYTSEEMLAHPWVYFVHPDDLEPTIAQGAKLVAGAAVIYFENRYRCKDGQYKWLSWTSVPVVKDGTIYGVARDMTGRKNAEQALRDSEARTRRIVETAYDAFVAMDATGTIIEWNTQAELIFGWTRSEAMGRMVAETIIPPAYREAHTRGLEQFFKTGLGAVLNRRLELSAVHRDGHEFPVELTIAPIKVGTSVMFSAFVHDISERKKAERLLNEKNQQLEQVARSEREAHDQLKQTQSHLVQTEKLASLGQMVAGVAHEINNPLSFVANNVAVLQRDVQAIVQLIQLYQGADPTLSEHQAELLAQIKEHADRVDLPYTLSNLSDLMARSREGLKRIQQIVKDLRDFARLDQSDLQDVDLNAGIESTLNIIRGRAKKKNIQIDLDLQPLPFASVYPAKINQVIMNLISNAIDACAEKGGNVKIRSMAADGQFRIDVQDNGTGVPAHIRERIFDPFFTTKKQGEGTGLGLSISYGIVKEHGGRIELQTEEGKGSTFSIILPRTFSPGAKSVSAARAN